MENYNIVFEHVSKNYGGIEVVKDLCFEIKSGERIILLGPSGCGKSTTLRMICGLEEITSGDLYMDGRRVNDIDSGDRNVAMVFQNYALFPHMTVFKNVAFGLRTYKLTKPEIKKRVDQILGILNLTGLEDRLPRQLSGGQRQRVALARATVKNAPYFLLDEPLSNLDVQLRMKARKELVKLHELNGSTFIYVTHDQIEAMTIGQRVAIMYEGRIQMVDTPYNIYYRPTTVFCARFIGSPPMNVVPVVREGRSLRIGEVAIELMDAWLRHLKSYDKDRLMMGFRPENMTLMSAAEGVCVPLTCKYVESYGNKLGIYFDLAGVECISTVEQEQYVVPCESAYWKVDFERLHLFDIDTQENLGYPMEYCKNDPALEGCLNNMLTSTT